MKQFHKPSSTPAERLKRLYYTMFVLTIIVGIANVVYLLFQPDSTPSSIAFSILQYAVMIALLTFPIILKRRFLINIPLILVVAVAIFAFVSMIMGDGLNFYGRYPWWDSGLHFLSGIVLAVLGLWILHLIVGEENNKLFLNRWFVALYILFFGLGSGAIWEIIEFTFDDIFATNTQQFMATTTASIISSTDMPLCGHAALEDTMNDLILDFFGSLIVACYSIIRHDKLITTHEEVISELDSPTPKS